MTIPIINNILKPLMLIVVFGLFSFNSERTWTKTEKSLNEFEFLIPFAVMILA